MTQFVKEKGGGFIYKPDRPLLAVFCLSTLPVLGRVEPVVISGDAFGHSSRSHKAFAV
jgi:hypothetical protein